jgi:hypothetical protein
MVDEPVGCPISLSLARKRRNFHIVQLQAAASPAAVAAPAPTRARSALLPACGCLASAPRRHAPAQPLPGAPGGLHVKQALRVSTDGSMVCAHRHLRFCCLQQARAALVTTMAQHTHAAHCDLLQLYQTLNSELRSQNHWPPLLSVQCSTCLLDENQTILIGQICPLTD